ncbi:MAG: hypothetical protein ING08_11250 [Roseomonas sp.]|nr:hypothetical protein [Roseomonas sp.]MCA3380807.1 hypothetical protein [Roseomonas sp.]
MIDDKLRILAGIPESAVRKKARFSIRRSNSWQAFFTKNYALRFCCHPDNGPCQEILTIASNASSLSQQTTRLSSTGYSGGLAAGRYQNVAAAVEERAIAIPEA